MSISIKPTGIIYCAKNTLNGRMYIGQSRRTLLERKKEHFRVAKHYKHKFATALTYYQPEVWIWEILAEVEVEKLNEYELFFINDLDTYKKGYNSTLKTHNIPKVREFEFYCPEVGVVKSTVKELHEDYIGRERCNLRYIYELVVGKIPSIKKWVLAKNKDNYDELVGHLKLSHTLYGNYILTRKEYIEKFNLHQSGLSRLTTASIKEYKGWKLLVEEK